MLLKFLEHLEDAIFGTSTPPPGAKLADKSDTNIAPAFAAIANLDEYIAAKAFDVISGILQAFMTSTAVTVKKEIKSESLAPGLTLFIGILECSYQSQSYFENEIITQTCYIYAVRYSRQEAKAWSDFQDLIAYENLKVAWRKKMEDLANKIEKTEDLSDLKKLQENYNLYELQLDKITEKMNSLQKAKVSELANRVESRLVNAGVLRQQIEALTKTTQSLERRFVGIETKLIALTESKVGAKPRTDNILVLFGHGAMTSRTFNFQRPIDRRIHLYAWTRQGIPVWNREVYLVIADAFSGIIRDSYATMNSSTVGGSPSWDYFLFPLDNVGDENDIDPPAIPVGYQQTVIAALNATVWHNAATITMSNRMILMVNDGHRPIRFSEIINDPNFNARSLDILWCACKSELPFLRVNE